MVLNSKEIFTFDLEQNSGRNTWNKNRVFWFFGGFFGIFLGFFENLISDTESASNFELEGVLNGSDPIFDHWDVHTGFKMTIFGIFCSFKSYKSINSWKFWPYLWPVNYQNEIIHKIKHQKLILINACAL